MLSTKIQVNLPFGLGEEAKNKFSRWPASLPPWIFNRNDLAIIVVQVIPMLPTKFQVKVFFSSREKAKNGFSRWRSS